MVAPLIVGAARVVGTKATQNGARKKVRKSADSRMRNSVVKSKLSNKSRNSEAAEAPLDAQSNSGSGDPSSQSRVRGKLNQINPISRNGASGSQSAVLIKQVKAIQVSVSIFTSAIGFYIPQIGFWILGIIGLGGGSIPILKYFFPGQTIYMLSYFVVLAIGICTMGYAAFMYSLQRVNCFSGYKGLIFILCLTGYLVMFINIFPWFIIWIWSVPYLQKEE